MESTLQNLVDDINRVNTGIQTNGERCSSLSDELRGMRSSFTTEFREHCVTAVNEAIRRSQNRVQFY